MSTSTKSTGMTTMHNVNGCNGNQCYYRKINDLGSVMSKVCKDTYQKTKQNNEHHDTRKTPRQAESS